MRLDELLIAEREVRRDVLEQREDDTQTIGD